MTLLNDERPSQAITILLVEDDAPTSWRLQDALAKAGFQVTAAATLAEARACLAQSAPKVLLTDLQLPDGHGVDLIRETRQRFPDTEITVISILGGLVPLVLASGTGADAQKSIGFATLTGMIGSTLLTVAVVPSLFVVLQQIEARLTSPKDRSAA